MSGLVGTSDVDLRMEGMAAPPLTVRREVIHQDIWIGGQVRGIRFEVPVFEINQDNLWTTHIEPRVKSAFDGYTRALRDSHQAWQVETEVKLQKRLIELLADLVESDPTKVEELLLAAKAARELKKEPAPTLASP